MGCCLLHPGYAKAGSTFLQEWFERHAQVRFVPGALTGLRSVFELAELAQDGGAERYRCFVTSNELLGSGGWIPHGCVRFAFSTLREADLRRGQAEICRLLARLFPAARVLVVTRGFESILRSLYSEFVKHGGETGFAEFLEAHASMLEQWLDVDFGLRLYEEAFGAENLLVLPYELLRDDVRRFVGLLESELGLDPTADLPAPSNVALGPDRLFWYARLSRGLVAPLAQRLPRRWAARIYRGYGDRVVRPDRLGPGLRLLGRLAPRAVDLTIPAGFLDRFRGRAGSLAARPHYAPYLGGYLLAESVGSSA